MRISPFTPLFFVDRKADGLPSEYIQTFAPSDKVLVEVFGLPTDVCTGQVFDATTDALLYDIVWNEWTINDATNLWFTSLSFSPGHYYVVIAGCKSRPFRVTANKRELDNTTLIQYSMNSNRHRKDGIFFIDGMQHFFDFRVHGGFKDSNWTFGVESESFVADDSDIITLYALDSLQQKFTLGSSCGCPIWFGEHLNRLLCCSYVYFDGVRYARKDASVPESTTVLEGVNSFVFNQTLQKVTNIDPQIELSNQVIMRRLDNSYRSVDDNTNLLI